MGKERRGREKLLRMETLHSIYLEENYFNEPTAFLLFHGADLRVFPSDYPLRLAHITRIYFVLTF